VTRRWAPKLGGYAGLAALGLLAALALGRPEPAVLATPFALLAGLGLALAREPDVEVALELPRDRVVEGEELELVLRLSSAAGARVDLELLLPPSLEADEPRRSLRLAPGKQRDVSVRLRPRRWGTAFVGGVRLRAGDPLRFVRYEWRREERLPVRVYPRPERARALLRPLETQVFAGNQVARAKGDGIEFADLRPFVAGDRVRRVNWRASARRGQLWVNDLHPERNADVVLLLDSFAEARRGDDSTLDRAVRAAFALAEQHLRERDRVGLVTFGGLLSWLLPGMGERQLYRILDALLESEVVVNYAWRDVDLIPRRTLPPQALVFCLTPLLDERGAAALLDLRGRGFDLAVIEISPLDLVEPGRSEAERLAARIWRLRREAVRSRLLRAGVPIAVWDDRRPLAAAVEEVRSFRRSGHRVRA
jgi:uncharacterized protein (DUF58 family)